MINRLTIRTKKSALTNLAAVALFSLGATSASCATISSHAPRSDDWVATETSQATMYMLRNISSTTPAIDGGYVPGVGSVLASPSQSAPNYYYYWVRDASLTMDTVATLYGTTTSQRASDTYYNDLLNFAAFSRRNQLTQNPSGGPNDTGLGEPKFQVDGSPYNDHWGRPQNDGPALRASALIHFANILIANGDEQVVRDKLYSAAMPPTSVIKADLEYVAHHWNDVSYDPWEEVEGRQYFVSAVQRKAMLDGAALADRLGDSAAADFYRAQAGLLKHEMLRHWDATRGYFVETLDWAHGLASKVTNLDSAIVVAALRACAGDGFLCASSDQILATAWHLEDTFRKLYAINSTTVDSHGQSLGTAIGRYPEDIYSGYGDGVANPWFLLTSSFGELCYQAAAQFRAAGKIAVTALNQPFLSEALPAGTSIAAGENLTPDDARFDVLLKGLHTKGDSFMTRVRFHMDAQGSLSEQINRDSGFQQGAHDLTWSYAAFLTAAWASKADQSR